MLNNNLQKKNIIWNGISADQNTQIGSGSSSKLSEEVERKKQRALWWLEIVI